MANNPKKDGGQRYDWESLKIEYVTTDISLRQLASKHGIREATVNDHSKAEGWFATKKKYKQDTAVKAIAKASTKRANSLARLMESSDKLLQHIEKAIDDTEQFNKYIVTESAPAPEGIGVVSVTYEKEFSKIDTKAIRDLANSIRTLADVMGYQKPTDVEKLKLERERFEFEKQKLDMARPDNHNTIEIEGYEEGWAE